MTQDSSQPAFNPHNPTFLKNPYPTYARCRDSSPVTKVEQYPAWWVFRYQDCRDVLDNKELFVKGPPGGSPPSPGPFGASQYMPLGLFSSDPPWHDKLRGVLGPLFVEAIGSAPEVATEIARGTLASFAGTQRKDLVMDFALPLPASVLFSLLGLPNEHWQGLIGWITAIVAAHDITQPVSIQAQGGTCAMALNAYYQGMLQDNALPKHSMLGLFVKRGQAEGLSLNDLQSSLIDITVAGYLSTTYLICTGLKHLLDNPEQRQQLHNEPSLWAPAIEEMLRIDAPAQIVDRYVAQATTLGGQALAAGDKISLILGSANHDEAKFADPDQFRIDRDNSDQLGFGWGIHHCIGAPLARAVTPVALMQLLDALPDIKIAGLLQWQSDPYLRGISNMPVSW